MLDSYECLWVQQSEYLDSLDSPGFFICVNQKLDCNLLAKQKTRALVRVILIVFLNYKKD